MMGRIKLHPTHPPCYGAVMGAQPNGTIAVACWCESTVLMVPTSEFRAGRTGCCGRTSCTPRGGDQVAARR